MNNKLVPTESLNKVKYGFFIESERKIYVSPTVMRLVKSDRELMRNQLKIFVMPKVNGKNKFDNLEMWLIDLVGRSHDIFEKERQDES